MPLDYTRMRRQAARLADLTDREFKVLEQRARRVAERQGSMLQRSRRRDPHAPDFGLYRLVDAKGGSSADGSEAEIYNLTLAEVVERLLGGGEVVELASADGKPAPTLIRGRTG